MTIHCFRWGYVPYYFLIGGSNFLESAGWLVTRCVSYTVYFMSMVFNTQHSLKSNSPHLHQCFQLLPNQDFFSNAIICWWFQQTASIAPTKFNPRADPNVKKKKKKNELKNPSWGWFSGNGAHIFSKSLDFPIMQMLMHHHYIHICGSELLDGLPLNLVHTSMHPSVWIVITLVIWLFI